MLDLILPEYYID